MPYYEHVFIARQDVSTAQVETMTSEFTEVIEAGEGRVAKAEYWGLKSLAYRIKKNRKGHYMLLNIDAPHAAVAEMERKARLNDDVIRFMTIRVDELEEGPSIVLRAKSGDKGRGPRRDRDDREPRAERSEKE